MGRDAEQRVHGALAVGRDQNERARGAGHAVGLLHRRIAEGDARRLDVVGEDAAEIVVRDLADEGRLAAERGDADHRIGGRAAGDFDARAHAGVERRDARLIDQAHAALGAAVLGQIGIVAAADDVDNGIADGDDVDVGGHGQAPQAANERESFRRSPYKVFAVAARGYPHQTVSAEGVL